MKMMDKELRIAEGAVALVRVRIKERLAACTYCETGSMAYEQAEEAVRRAFEDVRGVFHGIEKDIKKPDGRIMKADLPCRVHISEISSTGTEDQVAITISGMDGQRPYISVVMSHEAFGKVIAGNGFQPATMTRWSGR